MTKERVCANGSTMSRRSLLTALPLGGAALALPAMAGAGDDTPILRLFRQHQAILDAAGAHISTADGEVEDEELDRLYYRRSDRIENELMALPSTSAADFAAKFIVDTCNGGLCPNWETGAFCEEARALTGAWA